ncbi:ESPR domain-containing protein [Dyella sp. A6]|uniref:ESPR domain-containing protein n=1 Tax=Dyella aluminiiresistens TaxID=3069105 RepID=UPI002E79C531|nr:ESPR-type extended signal peptide-containing protein [Dyella sp. A6]
MNRIYSKVWSASLGHLVVASELARRGSPDGVRTGADQLPRFGRLALALLLLLGLEQSALAAPLQTTTTGTAQYYSANDGGTAGGNISNDGATATNSNDIVIGNGAGVGFVAQGVPSSRIIAVGYGKLDPVKRCADTLERKALIACLAPNRRVVIRAFQ